MFELLEYLLQKGATEEAGNRLPTLKQLSAELDVSVSRLREQLAVAKSLGLVDVRPRVGIRKRHYQFTPAVWQSVLYAIRQDQRYFNEFLDLRRHVELAYFEQAVRELTADDHQELFQLVDEAQAKLEGRPVRIPHEEHRIFHLMIYRRLENVFVTGILEAYWNAYVAEGLNVYADIHYLKDIWNYHRRLAETISNGEIREGQRLLREHFDLLIERLTS